MGIAVSGCEHRLPDVELQWTYMGHLSPDFEWKVHIPARATLISIHFHGEV